MSEPTIKDVSDTAFWIAHLRAVETERTDALFRDPLADRLAGERGGEIASPEATKHRQRKHMGRARQNAPFRFAPADWFGFYRERGRQCKQIRYLGKEGERLRRPVPLPLLLKIALKIWGLFLSKKEEQGFARIHGLRAARAFLICRSGSVLRLGHENSLTRPT
jgi:hypothetical protein